jgi:hypothetical protein
MDEYIPLKLSKLIYGIVHGNIDDLTTLIKYQIRIKQNTFKGAIAGNATWFNVH